MVTLSCDPTLRGQRSKCVILSYDSNMYISLRPSTFVMGSQVNLGSFGVTGVKSWFSLKMHYLLYVTYFINVTHTYASGWPLFKTYWLKFRFGITGVKRFFHQKCGDLVRPLNLTRALGKGRMSSSFFLSFFLTMIASSSTCLIGCLPNLVRSMCGCMATKRMGLKIHPGSYGVTRVKNVNHMKNIKTAPIQNLIMPSCRQ